MAVIVCAAAIMSCASCGNGDKAGKLTTTTTTTTQAVSAVTEISETTTTAPETTTAKVTTAAKPKKEKKKGALNPLTGLYDVSDGGKGRRPCAVMVNNIEASLPQYGIYDADIIFEIPVEGGITRLMALYADESDIPNVCSVRSARYYFALFAQSFDAVYLHMGIDKKVAEPMLEDLSIDHIDGAYNTNIYDRDENRLAYYDLEHTAYLWGKGVKDEIDNLGIRSKPKKGYDSFFKFYKEFTKPSGESCKKAVVNLSTWYVSQFDYDSKRGTYKKLHNGSKHMDASADKQLEFTNLLLLESKEIKVINEKNGLMGIDWKGGDGYLVTAGRVRRIKWAKNGEFDKLTLTDENGKALSINAGKTYIGVTPQGAAYFS